MTFRRTPIGDLWALDPAEAKRQVIAAVEARGGVLFTAALDLGFHDRRQLYRYLRRASLMPEVERIRREHRGSRYAWVDETVRVLLGDDDGAGDDRQAQGSVRRHEPR